MDENESNVIQEEVQPTEVEEKTNENNELTQQVEEQQEPKVVEVEDKKETSKQKEKEPVKEKTEQQDIEKVKREAKIQAIIDAVGENPWTGKPIENAVDVDEYLLMRRIQREGKDPITDYPEYIKKQKTEAEQASAKKQGDRENARKEIEEFKKSFPDVNLKELAADTDFDDFAKGAIGNEPLTSVYRRYIAFRERLVGNAEKKEQRRAIAEKAKANASVGSLSSESDEATSDYYTLEQMQGMSQKDIHDNWEKVQKSMKRLNKTN